MSIDLNPEHKSAHRLAFDHYLRTGRRLTTAQWLERTERKFNPYHDELGRFTSAPGVTVSWAGTRQDSRERLGGARTVAATPGGPRQPLRKRAPSKRPIARNKIGDVGQRQNIHGAPPRPNDSGFRSDFVQNTTATQGNADTYFDLNLRQADLYNLRQAAGPNPDPKIRADLDDFQSRLDTNRALLDRRMVAADEQALEIGRAGMAPVDIITGGVKIARGDAELRDYFSVGSVLPVTAIIRYVRGVPQIVGSRSLVTSIIKDLKLTGFDKHHNWAKNAMEAAGLQLPPDLVPLTVMLRPDHMKTGSWGNSFDAVRYRAHQAKFLEQGKFSEAAIMDAKNIDDVTKGTYTDANEELLRFARDMERKIGR